MKLLAKNAEERLPDRFRLEADLRRCPGGMAVVWSHRSIPAGAHDSSDRVLIPEKLSDGSARSTPCLRPSTGRGSGCARARARIPVIPASANPSGERAAQALSAARAFRSGQFDHTSATFPRDPGTGFPDAGRQILVRAKRSGPVRHTPLEAVGTNGQLIVSLVPRWSSSSENRQLFQTCRRKMRRTASSWCSGVFLCAFALPEHPLALPDDLQWLDAATLDLSSAGHAPEVRHLMLVGAYRDNEVSPSHRFCGRWKRSAKLERGSRRLC